MDRARNLFLEMPVIFVGLMDTLDLIVKRSGASGHSKGLIHLVAVALGYFIVNTPGKWMLRCHDPRGSEGWFDLIHFQEFYMLSILRMSWCLSVPQPPLVTNKGIHLASCFDSTSSLKLFPEPEMIRLFRYNRSQ